MKRKRKTEVNRIRRALTVEYHKLSDVLCSDDDDQANVEVHAAFEKTSAAIDCLNRELGRPEGS